MDGISDADAKGYAGNARALFAVVDEWLAEWAATVRVSQGVLRPAMSTCFQDSGWSKMLRFSRYFRCVLASRLPGSEPADQSLGISVTTARDLEWGALHSQFINLLWSVPRRHDGQDGL